MIVLDASAAVDVLVRRGSWRTVAWHLDQAAVVVVPDLFYAEVLSAIWRLVRGQVIDRDDAERAIALLQTMPVRSVSMAELLEAAWALREFVRMADAFYVACASRLDLPLLSTDARLARAEHGITVIVP